MLTDVKSWERLVSLGIDKWIKDKKKSGELSYFESKHESIDVNDDDATIIGKTKTLASPFGTSKSWWNLRQDLKAKKIDGKWILMYSKASSY